MAEEENIKFVSDIIPVVPTTKWAGIVNVPITVSIPNDINIGTYMVVAGLYSGDNRLALIAGSGVKELMNGSDDSGRYEVGTILIGKFANGGVQAFNPLKNSSMSSGGGSVKQVESREGIITESNSINITPSSSNRSNSASSRSTPTTTHSPSPAPAPSPISVELPVI